MRTVGPSTAKASASVPYLPRGNAIPDTPNTTAAGQEQAQIHRSRETNGNGKAPASKLVHIEESILDADETDPEDYNIRSTERTELLIKLKGLLDDVPVSPALWACFQLCDKSKLSAWIDTAKISPYILLGYEGSSAFIPSLCKSLVLRLYRGFDYRHAHG